MFSSSARVGFKGKSFVEDGEGSRAPPADPVLSEPEDSWDRVSLDVGREGVRRGIRELGDSVLGEGVPSSSIYGTSVEGESRGVFASTKRSRVNYK